MILMQRCLTAVAKQVDAEDGIFLFEIFPRSDSKVVTDPGNSDIVSEQESSVEEQNSLIIPNRSE
ncbi:MAG TPA: hypothetical protein VLA12_07555 [Planctomycetaceae bacterium]|nr:hypothetical protein [Planctomycetaceae bacterium]